MPRTQARPGTQTEMTLSELIGSRIRSERLAAGKRQEDVAEAARRWGFDWARSSVASLEAGMRQLSAEELLVIPAIIASISGATVGLEELLMSAPVKLNERVSFLIPAGLTDIAFHPERALGERLEPDEVDEGRHESETLALRRFKDRVGDVIPAAAIPAAAMSLMADLQPDPVKLERVARLVAQVGLFKLGAERLWGRSYTQERDRRLGEMVGSEDASPRTVQAKRGHISRQLDAELADWALANLDLGVLETKFVDGDVLTWLDEGMTRGAH